MARITKSPVERKKDIIIVAKKLFCERGYDKTTITDISNELGVAQGLIYHYFKSKSDILYSVVEDISRDNTIHLEKFIAEHKGTAIDCLRALLEEVHLGNSDSDRLISSVKEDKGIYEFMQIKFSSSLSPILVKLIERGNNDKSWVCNYPKESAEFIIYGFGACALHTCKEQSDIFGKPYKDIVKRVLGVST